MNELIQQAHSLIDVLLDAPSPAERDVPDHDANIEKALEKARECYFWLLKAYGLMPSPNKLKGENQ